jgi:preprotein translocase subunit SecE
VAKNVVDEPSEELVSVARERSAEKRTWLGRIILFVQQIMQELRKVVTPTRKELINYTWVVLVFVIIVMAIVYGLDTLFSAVVLYVFGTPS